MLLVRIQGFSYRRLYMKKPDLFPGAASGKLNSHNLPEDAGRVRPMGSTAHPISCKMTFLDWLD